MATQRVPRPAGSSAKRHRSLPPQDAGAGGGALLLGPDFGEGAGNDGTTFAARAAVALSSYGYGFSAGQVLAAVAVAAIALGGMSVGTAVASVALPTLALGGVPAGTAKVAVGGGLTTSTITETITTSQAWTVPTGVTSVTLQCWGGGGGGGVKSGIGGIQSGSGGGGGAFAEQVLAVTPGNNLTVTVAVAVGQGTTGGDTWVSNTGVAPTGTTEGALAKGGGAGVNVTPGTGGATGTSIGTTKFAGGDGATRPSSSVGGGGGGGAGTGGAGGNGSGQTGGTGTATGGGDGGTGGANLGSGAAGSSAGGGGGGCGAAGGSAGNGARGEVVLSYIRSITF